VLAVAMTEKYTAVGSHDGLLRLYDVRSNECVKTLGGHKGPITAIVCQNDSLFTASEDRCIRHYNLNELLYLETLYGHQFGVQDIDCPTVQERPVSVGRDRTARAWKLAQDTHLIFRGGSTAASADVVSCCYEDSFLTGHDDGSVRMWNIVKKRPLATELRVHGSHGTVGRPIVSLDSIKNSDVFATGSYDGYVNFWKMADKSMERMIRVPIHGFCNALALHPNLCLVAVGQEHRMGRWDRIAGAKNRVAIIPMTIGAEG
jgi:ribosomal RNA-processing protein 9